MHLNAKGTFFNKKPLEVFAFDSNPDVGIAALYTFGKVPTSKQSENFDANEYKILNDFKYLGIDVVPTFSIKRKFKIDIGVGFFFRRLINPEEVVVRREDIPFFDAFFEPPFSVSGEVRYDENEWGWTLDTSISLPINGKMSIGLEGSFYHYFGGMHDAPYSIPLGNRKWVVFTSGIKYSICFCKKRR